MKSTSYLMGLASFFALVVSDPAMASEQSTVVFGSRYWSSFLDYWQDLFQRQNGIGMLIVAVGIVALFIITRGKWHK